VSSLPAQRLQWQPLNGQEITFLSTTNSVSALASPYPNILIAVTREGLRRSTDVGITWQESNNGLSTTDTRTITTLGNLLICGVAGSFNEQGLFASADTAKTWKRISSSSFGTALFLKGIGEFLYGVGGTNPFVSTDTAKTWKLITVDTIGISSRFFFEDNIMYTTILTLGTFLYQSLDSGKQWQQIGRTIGGFLAIKNIDSTLFILARNISSIPDQFLRYNLKTNQWKDLYPMDFDGIGRYISTIHKIGKRLLYADNGNGVYSSDDLGETWQSDKQGLPPTFFINQFVTIGNFVYALGSVFGKGGIIYRASLSPLTAVKREQRLAESEVFPNPTTETVSFRVHLPASARVDVQLYNSVGSLVLERSAGWASAGEFETLLPVGTLPNGTYTVMLRAGQYIYTKMITVIH
jgi:hypothetical protein